MGRCHHLQRPDAVWQYYLANAATGGLWASGKLVNKVVSAMARASNPHGGQESIILSLYTSMHHWGAIVVALGYINQALFKAGGNPYGVSVTAGKENLNEEVRTAVFHQAKRTVAVGTWVKHGPGRAIMHRLQEKGYSLWHVKLRYPLYLHKAQKQRSLALHVQGSFK